MHVLFIYLFFEEETMSAPESFNHSRTITIFGIQNDFEQKAVVHVGNSENHIDNLMVLINSLIIKTNNKTEADKVFDNAIETFKAASNATSTVVAEAEAEVETGAIVEVGTIANTNAIVDDDISTATIVAINADVTTD